MRGNVIIVGLGLIGGSLGICLKKAHPEAKIVGIDTNPEHIQLAKVLGIIDESANDLTESASDADLIILSTPVQQTEKLLRLLTGLPLKENVIITDTGSTKEKIMILAEQLNINSFVGGHPMAGSHKSGVAAAKDILFENAFYLLTPGGNKEKAEILKDWLIGTKAQFVETTPSEHDKMTGIISHFPHLIASSLVREAEKFQGELPLLSRLAAGGFRDITRIASSSPEMWRDITLHNDRNLIDLLEGWKLEMEHLIDLLRKQNEEEVFEFFQSAKQFRDELPVRTRGAIPAFHDLYVDVPDYPGVISEVTGYLAEDRISITNIRILETREDIYGVLVISFQTEEDRERAQTCLQSHTDYDLFIP
ncbi:prephenate dehydrogenase [Falsibacillus albus]|uniref:Prephenate dehydrogenase n=1 Tax=Falsibacillus albus TaxID=2478915 RepID=A0A3L7JXW1_9BACI|nr:prephenate dehydrogenase [Falsibacillus albus]RLQ95104.1 prephenate dehydrogenase [Falsibacillus albus]